jgi:hypothetical protein
MQVQLSAAKAALNAAHGLPARQVPASGAAASVAIKKVDSELQVVWGEVYVPGFPDSQGDFSTEEDIRAMAWNFLAKGRTSKIDLDHSTQESGVVVVESFVARPGDPDFIPHAWVLGVHVPDKEVWERVKKGDYNGFSLDGIGVRVPTTLEFELPDELKGETSEANGHTHVFAVKYDSAGAFLGGMTTPHPLDGHLHRIIKGTVTEPAAGHTHRFSYVEGVLSRA